MFYLFLVLPLPVLILASYFLNSNKLYDRTGNIFIVSLLEGLGSYLIIVAFLLEGFIDNVVMQIVLFLVGFFIIAYTENNINEDQPEIDLQVETFKNIIVLFSSTILLFYIMLSVFRFEPFYLQLIYSLLVVIAFNFLAHFLKKWTAIIWDKISFSLSMYVSFSSWYVYVGAFVIFLIIVFFNFPKVVVNQSINLDNSQSYFGKPNGSNELVNRYEANKLIDLDVEMRMSNSAYINQNEDYIFIYLHDTLMIYNLLEERMIYSGIIKENVDGISVNLMNEETNEERYKTYCDDEVDCNEFIYPFEYGDVTYNYQSQILMIQNLDYNDSDTAIYTEDLLHLFKDEEIDSRVSTVKDKPFIGFNDSTAVVTDIDNHNGYISYLQLESDNDMLNIKVYQIIENDIDMVLPFYSHYRFGMLVFIFILGFVPITNYDKYRTEVH